jgi:hypothetical protein
LVKKTHKGRKTRQEEEETQDGGKGEKEIAHLRPCNFLPIGRLFFGLFQGADYKGTGTGFEERGRKKTKAIGMG